jgi:predicted XRE-type DNA-binding protein
MNKKNRYASVWDALEDDPIRRENLKLRSKLQIVISERIKDLKQSEAAEILNISQPRVSALIKGNVNDFRLDSLVDMAARLGLHVSIEIAA